MTSKFKKLMLEQIQENLDSYSTLTKKTAPSNGWIRTLRQALNMPSSTLAHRVGCSRPNINLLEQREKKGTITLNALERVAQALNCKLVYCLIPLESLEQQLENQARLIARKQIRLINHSMKLEQQGLTPKQLQQQEDELVQELLQGNLKNLWNNDDKV